MTRRNHISNSDNFIDSRDVIARIEELESDQLALVEAIGELEVRDNPDALPAELAEANLLDAKADLSEWNDDYSDELKALKALADEGENYAGDWMHGACLIRESYFAEYCEDMVKDIGDLPRDIPGYLVIDWEATANNLRADYSEVDFDGVTYLVR